MTGFLAFLADMSAKATLVLALTAVLAFGWRRASAAARHLVWFSGIVAVLLVPAVSRLLPPVAVPVPLVERLVPAAEMVAPPGVPPPTTEPPPAISATRQVPPPGGTAPGSQHGTLMSPFVLLALWGLGVAAVLGRVGAGLVSVRWLARDASVPADPAWAAALADVAARLGLHRPVHLLASDRTTVPMTWGWRRAVVLLPAAARAWSDDRMRLVVAHELTHVLRRDAVTQSLARVLCALQWFNPMAWLAAHRLRVEHERACDDSVLRLGTRASDYAAELLDIARASRRPAWLPLPGVAMARPSHLEGRLLAILDREARRGTVTPRAACAVVAVVAMVALPVAAVHPRASRFTAAQVVATAAPPPTVALAPAPAPVPEPPAPAREQAKPASPPPAQAPRAKTDGQDARAAQSLAFALQHDTNVQVRRQAAASLGKLPPQVAKAAFDALNNAVLRDRDPEVRRLSVVALARIGEPRVLDVLDAALRDADARVRDAAAAALGEVKKDPLQAEGRPPAKAGTSAKSDNRFADALSPDGKTVLTPKVLREAKPVYTREAMQAKIEGTVLVEAIVETDGSVRDVRVVKSLDGGDLDQAAIDAARKWQFLPGTRLGEPVRVSVLIEMLFTLRRSVPEQCPTRP